ncbi:immunoglobulin superfamily member 10 [Nothobranchius furzeri]|uniref:Immunoglobulin superfamily member 10 n=1 Tax=Nothobranchius furzeri TaxID=105023 RepID=A0A8C6VQ34_NOTFU|nr:immunoglobulin superfamily member 10 [Nothobranchius furzeri]XP_054598459.1 immunoglobulin superfamily member 10 [Nothobranchius furzeri]KAF7219368.1 immunoglobulin superfamily member 10 [Nothobranchius furzeri]
MSECGCSAPYLRGWFLTALLLLTVVQLSCAECPTSCVCHVPTEVHCTFRQLTAVPDHFPPAVEKINLGYNRITFLRETDLSELEKLELLMVHSNSIHGIEDKSFKELRSLQVLKLSNNRLKRIKKETFKGLTSLLRLHLDHNHIDFISPEAFYGLTNLQLVHLEGNQLQQLHSDTFITMRHSQVFKWSTVRTIHLSENLLETLPEDIFSGCSQLENLFLNDNPWMCDCRMKWLSAWVQKNDGVLKCKRDRRHPRGQLCPVCENPAPHHSRPLSQLQSDAFTCIKPWIEPHLKHKNISLEEGAFTPVSPNDFIAPLGSIHMSLTDQFHNDASLSCTVQRPTAFENLTQSFKEEEGKNVTVLTSGITTYFVCNVDYEQIKQLWQILATYSDSPMRLQRGSMVARTPEMIYRYSQVKDGEKEFTTNIEAEFKASPDWLMQEDVSLQLDRTTTTYSALHIKYQSVVNLQVESKPSKKDHYSWTMIKRDNQTKTEHTVITGGVAQLSCQIQGEPKPLLEWILPDGSKVRAPYSSEDRRIIISAEGMLTLRGADISDTGLYWCIATNYLDADILIFRVTVLSPDVEESEVNGLRLSKSLGENLIFDCGSFGSPEVSISWVLPDHSVLDKSVGHRQVQKNGTLLIQGLTVRDRGFYRCLVANYLGVDLLVSQVILSEENLESTTTLDNEGSGMVTEVKTDSSPAEHTVNLSELTSPSPNVKTSQKSRTITSDRRFPRLRSQGRGNSQGRLGQRRGGVHSRHMWSSRGLDKASRKVDPQKFAEFMKKAHGASILKMSSMSERVKHENPVIILNDEIGSGEGLKENHLSVVSWEVKPSAMIITRTKTREDEISVTTKAQTFADMANSFSHDIYSSNMKENANSPTTEAYMQSDSTSKEQIVVHLPGQVEYRGLEESIQSTLDIDLVTLKFSTTDSEQETQLSFSGKLPAETGSTQTITTDPNVTPISDGPVELFIHTDPKSRTTFTAITTAEKQEDEITFHTTQTIKSPQLSAGSTILSQQQIRIIPHKDGKGRGGRRILHSRRRIVKPNRITDIQSFINRFRHSTMKKGDNTSLPYQVYLTTECAKDKREMATTNVQLITPTAFSSPSMSKTQNTETPAPHVSTTAKATFSHTESSSDDSNEYITSADAPEINPPFATKKARPITSTTATTTTSKVIRGRIPWNRLFGRGEQEKILSRLKKPQTPLKTSTTPLTRLRTTTPAAMHTTSTIKHPKHDTLPPFIITQSKESSLDDDFEGLASADFELPTRSPNYHPVTTTSSSNPNRFTATSESPPGLPSLPSPPTVKPHSVDPDEVLSSGSGGVSENVLIISQRLGTRRQQERRRRPFRGRRPFRKPEFTQVNSKANVASTVEVTTKENTIEEAPPQQAVSFYKPRIMPPRKTDITTEPASTEQTKETDLYGKNGWTSSDLFPDTPFIISSVTTLMPGTTKLPHTTSQTRLHSNIKPPMHSSNGGIPHRSPARRVRPTAESSAGRSSVDKPINFDTITIFTEGQRHGVHSSYSKDIQKTNSPTYYHLAEMISTTTSTAQLNPTAQPMPSKPRIVGGNAASFTVLSNSDAFLPCEAVGNPSPVVTWKRFSSTTGGTILIKDKMGKFEVLSSGTLTIQNANIKDRGQYLCFAENDHGSDKLLVTLSVVAYPSRILEPKIRDMKSHTGNRVEMKCKAEGRPKPMISWILANRTQVRGQNTEKGRVSVSSEGTLVIEHVSVYDRGYYKCIASNPAGADTATVRLQVVAAPPGIVEEKRQQLRANLSQSLWLPCSSYGTPRPTIHWVLYDGSVVRSNQNPNGNRVSLYENGTLLIKDVTSAESGKYECIATSSTGSERRVVTLSVERKESAPHILETSENMTELSYGDHLRLHCSAEGDPKPKIFWKLPSKAVVDYWHRMGNRIQVLHNGTLAVNTVSDKDAGDYVCVARSTAGDDLQLTRVTVSMKPAKIAPKLHRKKQVPYGNDLKVDCKASGAPKPEITWGLPDGTVVNSAFQSDASYGGGRTRRYTLFDNGTLYLNQVSTSEEGDYTCYAENRVGKDEMHVHITVVTTAPRIHSPSQTYARLKPGGNIRFDCDAFGEPKPKILWKLSNNDVIAASSERYLIHVNGSLDIRNVKVTDAGEYVCMARNPGGENRQTYKLDIDGNPPFINGYRQNRTVIQDVVKKHSRKLIDCKAEGNPTPTITWIMPDNIFLTAPYFGSRINIHNNGTLEIVNVRPTDTGEFICLAKNDGGEAVMIVQLEVTSVLQRPIFKNPFNERVVYRDGKTAVINCSADGFPIPEIFLILPNGTKITSISRHGPRHQLRSDGTFAIYNTLEEDSGKYRCGAKNSLGYIEKLVILNIGERPYIITRPKGIIRGMFGEPLFLHCLSDGSPPPRIYWTIPAGHTLAQPQKLGRYNLLENGTLVVQDTTIHDRGSYTCRAHNNAGDAVLTVPVIISAYPPRITSGPPPSIRAVTGTLIKLNCGATGIPKPDITWELPDHSVLSAAEQGRSMGSEMLHPQGTLIIQKPKVSDSGRYTCLAKNPLGTDSKVTFVHVL